VESLLELSDRGDRSVAGVHAAPLLLPSSSGYIEASVVRRLGQLSPLSSSPPHRKSEGRRWGRADLPVAQGGAPTAGGEHCWTLAMTEKMLCCVLFFKIELLYIRAWDGIVHKLTKFGRDTSHTWHHIK